GDATGSEPSPGPDLVDLFPADKPQPGYLPVLRAYDYAGDEVVLMHADDIRLRRMAVFDVLVNNADRKGGHVLRDIEGHVYGVDHGVCLHVENKLRTVLWGWANKPVDKKMLEAVAGLVDALDDSFCDELSELITRAEIAALRRRAHALLNDPVMPGPNRHRPIPWPAF
ncbi:SCO1664 family protein, partial [Mycobacterium sp. E2497]|uniref:SCO1664 family protein n=1 Tax=Mycobacterium sp. E2497 TaxID=1834135 RepID=UPI000A80175B